MEKLVLLVALLFVFNGTLADEFVIKSSLSEIVKSFFSEKRLYFLIDESADGEILNQVLSENFNVTVQIERFNEIKQQPQRRRNVVILIESFDSFARLDDILTDTQFNFDGFFLIVCLNINRNQMNSMFRRLWEKFIYNVSLLSCCSNGLVTLQTFMPFNVENCFDTNSKVINVFHQETKRWKTKDFFPRKFENLYNCPIRFTSYEYAPAVMATRFKNGSFALKGCDIEFLKGLQSILNFQVNLNFLDTWGVLFENGTGTGAHKLLLENSSDVTIGWGFWSYSKKFYISSTEEYFMVPLGFIIPYGRSFTSFEKLFIPFQMKVWILFTLVIILAICVILFVEGRGRKFRAIFIGDNVKQPLMELLAALFGGSSHVEPRKHHPRYLLMIFLLFCLVMRTLYQSGLFKFMQSDQKGSDVTSINEMIDERYTIYSYQAYEPTWRSMKFSPITKSVPDSQITNFRMKTLNSNQRVAVISSFDEIVHLNQMNLKNYTYNVCKEHILMAHVVMFLQKNSYLKEAFDQKIKLLKSNGLINFWISEYMDYQFLRIKQPKVGPKTLSFIELLGGFQLWFFGLGASIIFFAFEHIVHKLKLKRSRL